MKICKQCGRTLSLDSFRPSYTNDTKTYAICLTCESINSREKYLRKKVAKHIESKGEYNELQDIYDLWHKQRSMGLKPPKIYQTETKDLLAKEQQQLEKLTNSIDKALVTDIPELNWWLSNPPLINVPEYYLNNIYEQLRHRYKPQIGIDPTTLLPIYDETYSRQLNAILDRFNTYEDEFYKDTLE